MKKIIVTMEDKGADYSSAIDRAKDKGYDCLWRPLPNYQDRKATIAALSDCDAVLAGGQIYDAEVLEALSPRLRIIARFGIGYDNVDLDCAAKLGVAVTNTPGAMSGGVADLAISMMLNIGRQLNRFDQNIKTGGWDLRYTGCELEGKTVGIVGFGNIGQRLAKYLIGFDCRILAYDIEFPESHGLPNVKRSDLDTIARESDYVSLHLPLTKDTRGIINRDFFAKMKHSAYLINTARGGVVAEKDMIEALKNRRIAGAALDVFEKEPLPADSELRGFENCLFTPHIASFTFETVSRSSFQAIDNIDDLFSGRVPMNILNPGYK